MAVGQDIARRKAIAAVGGAVLSLLLVAACSGSKAKSTTETSPSGGGVQAKLEALYAGTSTSPATTAPKPQSGKSIWIVSSGQSIDVAAQATGGAADAARAIGWKPKIFDGQFQPNVMLSGVQQAIAARADGIILYAIDCATVKAGLEVAKRKRIPVVGIESQDCKPSLETPITFSSKVGDFEAVEKAYGAAAADWLVAKSGQNATLIELKETDAVATVLESAGFESSVEAACAGCKVVTITFTGADIGPGLQQKTQQALLQHSDAAGLFAPYDALVTSGGSAAVLASGRAKQLHVISGGGSTPNLDLIRQGRGQNADVAASSRWEGFAAVDWMNRLFHGLTPTASNAPTGIGFQLVDADHNLPKSGPVPSTIDFESIYEKAWGVRG